MNNMIATRLLEMQNQLRVYHWQTKSYARHVALGGAYDDLSGLIDGFVELIMGIDGIVAVGPLKLHNKNQKSEEEYVDNAIDDLRKIRDDVDDYPDLVAIADDMIGVFGKLKYLFTLK